MVPPDARARLQIESPRAGERILVGETRLLEFSLEERSWLAVKVNGLTVREPDVYDQGKHNTVMDFLDSEETNGIEEGLPRLATKSRFDLEVLTWDVSVEEPNDSNVKEKASVHIHVSNEPPNVMFQFPPDKYVYTDPSNVNVAVLVTYFAFHRFPSIINGFVKVFIDWDLATTAQIVRDSEGVFEITMSLAQPFNRPGWHHIQVQLSDSQQQHVGGPVELLYKVEESHMREDAEGGGGRPQISIPIGSWSGLHKSELRSQPPASSDGLVCSGHGWCVGSTQTCECVCRGDWVGRSCNVSLETEVEYYPEAMPALSDASWALSASLLNGSRELLHKLQNLHRASNCTRERVLVFEYNDQGLAAVVSDATVQLTYSFARSRAAVFEGEWTYGLHKGCLHAAGVACHFHPHFDCEASQDFDRPEFQSHPRDVIPDEYSERGAFWWYAHMSHYLLQENFDFQLKIASAKAQLGFRNPIIGVHVRNGDYCSYENDSGGICLMYKHCICDGFEPYLDRIRRARSLYGISTVFLATQDPRIIAAAKAEQGLRVLHLEFDREQLTGKNARKALHWRQKQGYVDSEMVSESALLDLFLLRDSDVFIGAFHSQYSRLAYQLMAIKQGLHPPFSSVHLSWGSTLTYPL